MLQFYALARFNGISNPSQVRIGQSVRIPATEQALAVRESGVPEAEPVVEMPETESAPAPQPVPVEREPTNMERALELAQQGDIEGAYQAVLLALEEEDTPENRQIEADLRQQLVEAYYRDAVTAFRAQDLDVTIARCNQVLELDPDHDNARLYKAQAEELQARLDKLSGDQQR